MTSAAAGARWGLTLAAASDNDEICAVHGVDAAGLVADAGTPAPG